MNSSITAPATAVVTVRRDLIIVAALTLFAIGWAACSGAYSVGWLEWRSSKLEEVSATVGAPNAPTEVAVSKAKNLIGTGKLAKEVGCAPI